jgi:hypothetical protein
LRDKARVGNNHYDIFAQNSFAKRGNIVLPPVSIDILLSLSQNNVRLHLLVISKGTFGIEISGLKDIFQTSYYDIKGIFMKRFFTLEYWLEDEWYVGRLKRSTWCFQSG